jgi:nucleoside-diphosphate-sugar epimerase
MRGRWPDREGTEVDQKTVVVTGGAGYVGSVLVPQLLAAGHKVRVIDLYWFGEHTLDAVKDHPGLEQIKGDIRDQELLKRAADGADVMLHLACVANDPCFELNSELSKSINFDAFEPLVKISKASGIGRFIYASTCSVYGISDAPEVTEEHPLVPVTDYNKFKGLCEPILLAEQSPGFDGVVIRPATVCGYSPRQRLDLTVNILTNNAVNKGQITVFGGEQTRPNIHIQDIVDLYTELVDIPADKIAGETFNAGYQNRSVAEIAQIVREIVSAEVPGRQDLEVVTTPSDDTRSYRISSEKIKRQLGYEPQHTIEEAVRDLIAAFSAGKLPNPMDDVHYYNVKTMQALDLA